MSQFQIIAGHNGTPVPLDQISPPALADFRGAGENVLTEFHDYIARELAGDRSWTTIGKPYAKVTLYHVLRTDFPVLFAFSGDVTVRLLQQSANTYHIYNGSCKSIEAHESAQWDGGALQGWTDVVMEFYDLIQIG